MTEQPERVSPHWSQNTKLVVSFTIVAIAAALILRFNTLLGPIFFAFIVAYLLHPVASFLSRKLPISWRMAVNIIYLVFIFLLIYGIAWGGLNLITQIQSLINVIQASIVQLPEWISTLSSKIYQVGPFQVDLSKFDLPTLGQEILSAIQPMIGKLGDLVSSLASSAASTVGWLAFIVVASYFLMAESGGLRAEIIRVDVPVYAEDMKRMGNELGRIWNAFLRGQLIIFTMTVIVYSILLPILGVRYAIGLAFLAAFANFLPYIGPAINWIALALVTSFMDPKPFGLTPWVYTVLVIGCALLVDQIFNNLIIPRIMAKALKVHPAAVLISAIIAANLIGLIGLLIAAPLLATMILIGRYTLRKLLNRDPWPAVAIHEDLAQHISILERIRTWWRLLRKKVGAKK
jgi:predicted PurR-regulated permease PerM